MIANRVSSQPTTSKGVEGPVEAMIAGETACTPAIGACRRGLLDVDRSNHQIQAQVQIQVQALGLSLCGVVFVVGGTAGYPGLSCATNVAERAGVVMAITCSWKGRALYGGQECFKQTFRHRVSVHGQLSIGR